MNNTLNFRPDLQGLRAIAVLLVVFAHAEFKVLEGGFIGVDIFFVLSGYLITGILLKEYDTAKQISLVQFYTRRIKRLLPSLLLVVLVSLLAASLLLSSYEFIAKTRSSFYALGWLSNLYFAFAEVGYFAEIEQQDIFLHTWSLGVEEQFYLFWPAFILTLYGLSRLFRRGSRNTLGLGLVAAFSGSLALCLYWSENNPLWGFYLMPARIWQFSLGALVFFLAPSLKQFEHTGRWGLIAQLFAITTILISATWVTSSMTYPSWVALFPSLAAALIVAFPSSHGSFRPLSQKPLTYIGDRSYAWYLWHWPVFSLAKSSGFDVFWYQHLCMIILSFLLAMASYRYIELPFWKGKFSKFSNAKTLTAAFIAILALVAIMLNLLNFHHRTAEQFSNAQITNSVKDLPVIYSYDCDSWYESSEVRPCVFGDDKAKKTLVLFGDSVLGQWFSLFWAIYPPPEWRIIVLSKSACPIVDEDFYYTRIGAVYDVCRIWRNKVLARLKDLQPDVVVIGNATNYDFTEEQWINGSTRIFDQLSQASPQVYVLVGTPRLGFNGPACLLKNGPSISSMRSHCVGRETLEVVGSVSANLHRASEEHGGVELLDLNDLICPDGQCPAITREGVVVYRDSQHLTDTYVQNLLSKVLQRYPGLGK